MCRTPQNIRVEKENDSVKPDMPRTAHLPCEPIKPQCFAGGRTRPSCIRRNLNREVHDAPKLKSEESYMPYRSDAIRKHFILDGKGDLLHNAVAPHDSAPHASSPPIQAAKKKMRSAAVAASFLGVRAGTSDAVAHCRGDLKGANIWDYFGSTATDVLVQDTRLKCKTLQLSARQKAACISGGHARPSSVVRNLRCFGKTNFDNRHVDDNNSQDCSRPWSPMGSVDFEVPPCQITVVTCDEQHSDYGICLPPVPTKDSVADSGKLIPPTLKFFGAVLGDGDVLGDVPKSRRPSMDSVSTAPSESDVDLSRTSTSWIEV